MSSCIPTSSERAGNRQAVLLVTLVPPSSPHHEPSGPSTAAAPRRELTLCALDSRVRARWNRVCDPETRLCGPEASRATGKTPTRRAGRGGRRLQGRAAMA